MRVSHQARKELVLNRLVEARAAVLRAVRALPPERQFQVFLGEWSAADLVAHLIGWDHTNAQAARELVAGQLPGFYAHYDPDWRSYNASLVARHRKEDMSELLADVEASHQELLAVLAGIPAAEFVSDKGLRFRGWKVTIERLLLVEAKDELEHARHLEAFGGIVT